MSLNLPNKDNIPSYFEEDVLNYLEQQQKTQCAGESDFKIPKILSGHDCVTSILQDIVSAIEKQKQAKVVYDKTLRDHNQYDLFDLSKTIPGFCIDEELYEKMTFRETLVIGVFENNSYGYGLHPDPAGGFSLNIEMARGSQPLDRKEFSLVEGVMSDMNLSNAEADEFIQETDANSNQSEDAANVSTFDENLQHYTKHLKKEMKREHCKFLVHLSTQFDYEKKNGGSRITSWVDKNFHTLEEKRNEYLCENGKLLEEKSLYVALQKKRYFVKHRSSKENLIDKKFYSLLKARHYISEGANFVLMRYLAITKYIGQFELSTMYINGDMCRNIYFCSGIESGIINNKKIDICKINRTIIEECGITHQCVTVLTLNGQIVKQDWQDCNVILMVNPLSEVSENPKEQHKIPLKNTWEEDMEVFSRYLDFKSAHCTHIKSYLADHPEIQSMLADYVQMILLMKPEDVLEYTLDYFMQYIPEAFPRNEYFEQAPEEEEPYFII